MNRRHVPLQVAMFSLLLPLTTWAATLPAPTRSDRIPPAPAPARQLQLDPALDRTPVQWSWRIDAEAPLVVPAPHQADSREFWIRASAAELQRGVDLRTTAPGAVVRISPVQQSGSRSVDPLQVQLALNGTALDRATAVRSVLTPADINDGAAPFPEGSSAFRLAESAGAGRFTLSAPDAAGGDYLIHVFDVASTVHLRLQTQVDTVFAGQRLDADIALSGAALRAASGLITAPDGSTQRIEPAVHTGREGGAQVSVDLELPALGASAGLYELHVWTSGGEQGDVQRDVRTAFAVAAPTARLAGSIDAVSLRGYAHAWQLGVDIGQAGRYQLEGVLYQAGKPFAIAQSAAWLEPGTRQLTLGFDHALFADRRQTGLVELRDVRLIDQGQLVTLERRERAWDADSKR